MPAPPTPQIIEDLRFLHPPWEWWRSWPIVLTALGSIVAITLLIRMWVRAAVRNAAKRRRMAPCRATLAAMRDLLERWDQMRPDRFAIELSATLRGYLEAMGAGPCSKMTAVELVERLPRFNLLDDRDVSWFCSTASRCEPTKWAGHPMTKEEASRLVGEGMLHVRAITDRRESRIEASHRVKRRRHRRALRCAPGARLSRKPRNCAA